MSISGRSTLRTKWFEEPNSSKQLATCDNKTRRIRFITHLSSIYYAHRENLQLFYCRTIASNSPVIYSKIRSHRETTVEWQLILSSVSVHLLELEMAVCSFDASHSSLLWDRQVADGDGDVPDGESDPRLWIWSRSPPASLSTCSSV